MQFRRGQIYKCTECDQAFKRKESLKGHMFREHNKVSIKIILILCNMMYLSCKRIFLSKRKDICPQYACEYVMSVNAVQLFFKEFMTVDKIILYV